MQEKNLDQMDYLKNMFIIHECDGQSEARLTFRVRRFPTFRNQDLIYPFFLCKFSIQESYQPLILLLYDGKLVEFSQHNQKIRRFIPFERPSYC